MQKLLGIILILVSGAALGFEKSRELTVREKNLGCLLRMVTLLKGEIRCGNASIREAFCQVSRKMPGVFGVFLRETAKRIQMAEGLPLGQLFRQCAGENLGGLMLSREEWETFCDLGEYLGYLDREMQLRQLENCEEELTSLRAQLREEMPGKKKVYQSLGIFGAVFLAVLVW